MRSKLSRAKVMDRLKNTRIIVFLLLLTLLVIRVPEVSARPEGYFTRDFEWSYKGSWTWQLNIPYSYYYAYKGVSVNDRTKNDVSGYSYLVTTEDSYIQSMAEGLREVCQEKKWRGEKEINFVLAFVQCLPYTVDSVTAGYDEYPRFPLESLVDGGGDCEDTAILFITLVTILGYDAIFINPEGHMAVGVKGDFYGTYWKHGGKKYFYCETTGEGWRIGNCPEHIDTAYLYPVSPDKQFDPKFGRLWYLYSEYVMIGGGIFMIGLIIAVVKLSSKKSTPTPQPIVVHPPPPPMGQIYCPQCGSENLQGATHCVKCGAQIRS